MQKVKGFVGTIEFEEEGGDVHRDDVTVWVFEYFLLKGCCCRKRFGLMVEVVGDMFLKRFELFEFFRSVTEYVGRIF